MFVQACINGSRPNDFHPLFPVTADEMARDCAAAVDAGATEQHVHPRDANGRESLKAADETIYAIRKACPGTLVGVSARVMNV
jgi:uncharacterized protein (DUF849 family)